MLFMKRALTEVSFLGTAVHLWKNTDSTRKSGITSIRRQVFITLKQKEISSYNQILIVLFGLMIAIVLGLGVLILIEGPEIITQHVKNLKLVQKGTSIEVTWDEMECEGYVVMIRMEEERATYPKLETNSYTIELSLIHI